MPDEVYLAQPSSEQDASMIVRYQMFCDDKSGNIADEARVAELVCSLTSLKLHVEPFLQIRVVIFTLPRHQARLEQILNLFQFRESSVLDTSNSENEEFAATIVHCAPVDRLCIRRMLADFSILPSTQFRLLLGTDIIFLRPPVELINFVKGPKGKQVLYLADTPSFEGALYRLSYHDGKILAGLLGDFYCLAPGVSLSREAIMSCLRRIDSWPAVGRWNPHPQCTPIDLTHACEQQAAAVLLADFSAQQLPADSYFHVVEPAKVDSSCRNLTVLHAHAPWVLMLRGALPSALKIQIRRNWSALGLDRVPKLIAWPRAIFLRLPVPVRVRIKAAIKGRSIPFRSGVVRILKRVN